MWREFQGRKGRQPPRWFHPHWRAQFWCIGVLLLPMLMGARGMDSSTNHPPTRVAVLPWLPVEPPPMAMEDRHWLRTFRGLVNSALHELPRISVVPRAAMERELARLKLNKPVLEELAGTNRVLGSHKLGESLRVEWLLGGGMARTGMAWTVYASAVNVTTGELGDRFNVTSTNWFVLRDEVVRHFLRQLDITTTLEDQKALGRVWTHSGEALNWASQANFLSESNYQQSVDLCRKALEEDPQFVEARCILVGALYGLGRDEESLRVAREALRQRPDKDRASQLHLACAYVLLRQGQKVEAQQEVAEGLRLNPDNCDLLALQSVFHEQRGDLEAAGKSLGRALESDPRNPAIYARIGRLQSKQGNLTNALANLKLAEQLMVDVPSLEVLEIKLSLAKAYESVGNLTESLRYYRTLLAEARAWNVPDSRIKFVEETVQELERRSQPVAVMAEKPRTYSPGELENALRERLNPEELALAVNPIISTPEMARWADEIVAGTEGELARARKLFEELNSRPKATGGSSRTAQEVFAGWNDLSQLFLCQEYARLFVALARSVDLAAFYVHVDRDYCGRIVDHDCAVVFAEGKAWLVDPAYAWFGVPHLEFRVLDDLQTIAHYAFQPHDQEVQPAICRAGCKLDPESTWGRMNLAAALINADQLDEARKELDRARKDAPDFWRGYLLEGWLAINNRQPGQAVKWLRQAVEANPDHEEPRYFLGLALFHNGEHAQARDELKAGLARSGRGGSMKKKSKEMALQTLALLEQAVTESGSNAAASSTPATNAADYYNLGVSFLTGAKPNPAEAAKWFRKAAEMGYAKAQGTLGVMHWTGRGVSRDKSSAIEWLKKGASGGDAAAMKNLGVAYVQGFGVKKGPKEAFRWFRRAAEAGDAEGQLFVGWAHYEGKVVPKDMSEALFWLMLASEAKSAPSVSIGDGAGLGTPRDKRQIQPLLREVKLFASEEEVAEANKRLARFKAGENFDPGKRPQEPQVPGATP